MKTNYTTILFFCLTVLFNLDVFAQLDIPRSSPQAKISQRVGISDITIIYSRPSVNDRDIWGSLVPYGMNNLGFGTATESPWRAGADENTVIKFSDDVTIDGQALKAGKYGFHVIVEENDRATLIFSNDYQSWGSYFYNPENDALRVDIKTQEIPHTEILTYSFDEVDANSSVVSLKWAKKAFPFKVQVDVPSIVLANLKEELKGQNGFTRQNWETAAAYALNNGDYLDEALTWVDAAIAGQFFSQKTFNNLQIKSQILSKMGKTEEADKIMNEALELANVFQAHQYGRTLIAQDKKDKALEIFKHNAKVHKDEWPVNYGMARGYSALGDYKKALSYLKMALNNAPNDASKGRIQANIDKLQQGQDIN